jgi:TP53 regulating kinase-like protein
VLIDFGLACQNASLEDMGVDLYVLERALNSAHAREATVVFAAILAAYTAHLTAIAPKNHHGAAAVAAKKSA